MPDRQACLLRESLDDSARFVARAVVGDNDFERWGALAIQRVQATVEQERLVESRDDHRATKLVQ
jgi:hypothetical protein